MRFPIYFLCACVVLLMSGDGNAECRPGALGTSRNVVIDPAKHHSLVGNETVLGLRQGEVILTFDDGPIAGNTARILQTLKQECVKATFFYVGKMARAYPRLVRKVVAQGHTLAHHTHAHNRLTAYSIKRASALIDRGVSQLQMVAYGDPASRARIPLFRYPYLAQNTATNQMLARKGLVSIGANIDSRDWEPVSPGAVHDRIMKRLKKVGRGIILMHDIQSKTAKMLPRLLRSLKAGGYRVVHMITPKYTAPEPAVASGGTGWIASAEPWRLRSEFGLDGFGSTIVTSRELPSDGGKISGPLVGGLGNQLRGPLISLVEIASLADSTAKERQMGAGGKIWSTTLRDSENRHLRVARLADLKVQQRNYSKSQRIRWTFRWQNAHQVTVSTHCGVHQCPESGIDQEKL